MGVIGIVGIDAPQPARLGRRLGVGDPRLGQQADEGEAPRLEIVEVNCPARAGQNGRDRAEAYP